MQVTGLDDAETVETVEGVYLTQLAADERTSVQHFRIESGAKVPEHSHHHEQAGYVASGSGVFLVGGEELVVEAGDSYVIPGDEPHAVEVRGDEPLLGVDIFSPPRTNPDWE